MASQRVWNLCYVVGNPKMFSKVTVAAGSPYKRSEALEAARAVAQNGGGWRVWVQHCKTSERIFQSDAELEHTASQS